MDIMRYVTESALVLIPVLIIIGQIIKDATPIPNKWIPVILMPLGIVGAIVLGGVSPENVVQGILVAGAAVYGNQIYKQLRKGE